MSKQRPNPDKLANELAGASAFFRSAPSGQPEPQPPQVEPEPPITPEPPIQSDVMTSRRQRVTTSPETAPAPPGFDINRLTASRDSLRLSVDETKALDALRATLKWDHDLTVSKNDICRAALHLLLEEFAAKGERSDALKRLKRKQASR